jgi:hypothetical protein
MHVPCSTAIRRKIEIDSKSFGIDYLIKVAGFEGQQDVPNGNSCGTFPITAMAIY